MLPRYADAMTRTIELWRWYVNSQTRPGKRVATRYAMSEADALATDPTAERVPGTMEVRDAPENDREAFLQSTSAIRPDGPKEPKH